MERAPFLSALLIAGTVSGQPVLLTGFESNGAFDLSGVYTYCSLAAIQGSSDTPGGGSLWSAEIPASFSNTCTPPSITQGLFFKLPGLSQGQHVGITFQHKVPVVGALSMNILYVNPAGSSLPAMEQNLGFPEIGFYDQGAGPWNIFTGSFDVPTIIPWPSDLYLVIRYMPGEGSTEPALIDNVEMSADVNTGIDANAGASGIVITPLPAQDRITVTGMSADAPTPEVFNNSGLRVTSLMVPLGNGVFDIHGLSPGLYVLRQGERCTRFIKD